jgi:ATP-dependent Lon protease
LAEDRLESTPPGGTVKNEIVLKMLSFPRWDSALGWLRVKSIGQDADKAIQELPLGGKGPEMRGAIERVVEALYSIENERNGALAFCWLMLLCDPTKPTSFTTVLPYLQWCVQQADADLDASGFYDLADRLKVWWACSDGDHRDSRYSVFSLADGPNANVWKSQDDADAAAKATALAGPGVVVMPKAKAAKLKADHAQYKDLVDKSLPLVVARDVAEIRRMLACEYPHAVTAIDLVLRDLREGEAVRLKPFVLVGPPGNGKSTLVRRLFADLLGIGVFRFDAGNSNDSVGYGGTARGWSESTPCAPFRAVHQYGIANPIVMVDELEKASPNPRNGSLWSVLLAHLERETASRYRDHSLDAELDLSWVNHIATANSIEGLPEPLRDRYRVVRVPAPQLVDLPVLAANILRAIAAANGEQGFEIPLAADELEVIAKAWQRAGFSIRKLGKIVAATLLTRDLTAMRH